jgi:hypothetical protein
MANKFKVGDFIRDPKNSTIQLVLDIFVSGNYLLADTEADNFERWGQKKYTDKHYIKLF